MKFIILLIVLTLSTMGQKIESEKTDTISLNSLNYLTWELKIHNYSASDPAEVFVTAIENFDTLKRLIPKYYFARKQEFNEYYILGVPDLTKTNDVDQTLIQFLNKIDSLRQLRSRSTFRQVYTWDNVNKKINSEPKFKELSQIDNLFYLKSLNDICKYMLCPNKH